MTELLKDKRVLAIGACCLLILGGLYLFKKKVNALEGKVKHLKQKKKMRKEAVQRTYSRYRDLWEKRKGALKGFVDARRDFWQQRRLGPPTLVSMRYYMIKEDRSVNDDGIRRLNGDILRRILGFCDDRTRAAFARTCQGAQRVERDSSYWKWRRQQDFPTQMLTPAKPFLEKRLYGLLHKVFIQQRDLTETDLESIQANEMKGTERFLLEYCAERGLSDTVSPRHVRTFLRACFMGCEPIVKQLIAKHSKDELLFTICDLTGRNAMDIVGDGGSQHLQELIKVTAAECGVMS